MKLKHLKIPFLLAVLTTALGSFSSCSIRERRPTEEEEYTSNYEEVTKKVKWHLGYVGSNSHSSHANEIYAGTLYSYSDVITIPEAGTLVTFFDVKGSEDTNKFASNAVYLVSHWIKNSSNEWVIDLTGTNIVGGISGTTGAYTQYYKSGSTEKVQTSACPSLFSEYDESQDLLSYTYVTSKDNEHIRLCYRSEYTDSYNPAHQAVKLVTFKKSFDSLKGKTVYALGDSYFHGDSLTSADTTAPRGKTWLTILAEKYDWTLRNYSKNGAVISTYSPNSGQVPMCEAVSLMDTDLNPDIILFEGGKNDFNRSTPLGDINSGKNTFVGAVAHTIDALKAKYPNAILIGFTPWNDTISETDVQGETLTVRDYAVAFSKACKAKGVYCFDAYNEEISKVHVNDETFRLKYFKTKNDKSHLNQVGMYNFSFVMEEWLDLNITSKHTFPSFKTVSAKWNLGYVGSNSNTSNTNKLAYDAAAYQFSGVITVPKAGTTVMVVDNNTESRFHNSGTTSGVASSNAYVISHWTANDAEWVIDTTKTNIKGNTTGSGIYASFRFDSSSNAIDYRYGITYRYTTTEDNEKIRICIRTEAEIKSGVTIRPIIPVNIYLFGGEA